MKVTSPKRGRRPTKRLDMTDIRHLFADTRMWCSMGIVQAQGDDQHFEITDTDVLVEVVLQPSLVPVTARLTAGMMRVPAIGDEVLVQVPEGRIDFLPTIVDWLTTAIPTEQGPAVGRTLVVTPDLVIHDGAGGAESLAFLSALTALQSAITGWTPVPNDGGAALKAALSVLFMGPPAWPTGTTVLKAK